MAPRSICLINQKGGCGKSSTCFHLAGAFAEAGLRVLLIDADPQGSLSQGFFGSEFVESLPAEVTVAALLDDGRFPAADAELVHPTHCERIFVSPANQHAAPFNTPSPESGGLSQYALREFIARQAEFEIVLIDCPPNLYRCSWSALLASDGCVIPVPPEDFGTQGLRAVQQAIDEARRLNPRLELLGHLITRSDKRLLVHRAYEERLRGLYGEQVLETVIPEASAFKVALVCRQPVQHYSPRAPAAVLTRKLASELLDRMAARNKRRCVA